MTDVVLKGLFFQNARGLRFVDTGSLAWTFDPATNSISAAASGSGGVDTANSPNANEFARFTDADTIEGRTAAETRADLDLEIGTDVQAYDVDLTTWAGLTPSAFFQTLVDDADAATFRTTIGALASASYTAADVLTKLLTVDGPGSLIDADFLDGNSSAAFALASHTHAQADVTSLVADLALKAPLASPTFTGTVALPTAWSVNGVTITPTGAELNFVTGVTSAIQTQLDAKLASASYTAADVLTKLLTVDGPGSLIDADFLDGNSSAAFALASHTHSVSDITDDVVPKRTIGMTFDGDGSPPTVGSIGYVVCQHPGTIDRWNIIADQSGSAVVEVWKVAGAIPTGANAISGTEKPTLAAAQLNADTSLTTWTTLAVAAGDVFGFELESVTTCTRVTVEVRIAESA